MTLDEMTKEFESRFAVHPVHGDRSRAPTGELYIDMMAGTAGVPEWHEGGRGGLSPLYRSEASCIDALLETLTKYAEGKTGTLYWRNPPEIDFMLYKLEASEDWVARELKVWRGYARLLISDRPVVDADVLAGLPHAGCARSRRD